MKIWFLDQEIEAFRPLRHVLNPNTFKKITVSNKLIQNGFNETELLNEIYYKGFVMPDHIDYIVVNEKAYHIKNNTIIDVILLKSLSKKPKQQNDLISYKEFVNKKLVTISNKLKIDGMDSKTINEDLKAKAVPISTSDDVHVFETIYFIYNITKRLEVINIKYKENNEDVLSFLWSENGVQIRLKSKTINIDEYYAKWLSYISMKKYNNWYYDYKPFQSIKEIIPSIQDKWIVHPNIWDNLKINSGEMKQKYIDLWQKDLTYNAMFISHSNGRCKISGWKFNYVWDGIILIDILLPNNATIYSVELKENSLNINNSITLSVSQLKPKKITDLLVGNKINLLPRSLIYSLQIHEHAITRYGQRIDDEAYLCEMTSDIYEDLYNYGIVIEGAHIEERRKIASKNYGYALNDEFVISVWNKDKQASSRIKKKNKNIFKKIY